MPFSVLSCHANFLLLHSSPNLKSHLTVFSPVIFLYVLYMLFPCWDEFSLLVICYYPFRSNIISIFSTCAGLEGVDEISETSTLSLLMWSFTVPVVQQRAPDSPPGLRILTRVPCLWSCTLVLLCEGPQLGTTSVAILVILP